MYSRFSWICICAISTFLATSSGVYGQTIINRVKADLRSLGKQALVRVRPKTGADTQIETLAREIDWLEGHIDKFGSVVAKQPDIWGESRLTKYRREFENELAKQLSCFNRSR